MSSEYLIFVIREVSLIFHMPLRHMKYPATQLRVYDSLYDIDCTLKIICIVCRHRNHVVFESLGCLGQSK